MSFVIEALVAHYERGPFACGVEALDRYLKEQANQDVRRRVARVFVALPEGSHEIAGFYTLSAGSVSRDSLPQKLSKRLPHYPVPVAILGRLAVDRRWAGKGLGAALVGDAVQRIVRASTSLAIHAIVVDAKDEAAHAFYEHLGFIPLPEEARRLFLPLSAVEKLTE